MGEDKNILHELREQGENILDTVTKIQTDVQRIRVIDKEKDDPQFRGSEFLARTGR